MDAPDDIKTLRKHLKAALALMDDKSDDYEVGRDMYTGERTEVASSRYVQQIIDENVDAYPISLAHIPVDVIVDMIELTSLDVKDARAKAALDIVTEANDFDDLAEDCLRKAGYFGDYYAIVDPAAEEVSTAGVRVIPEEVRWIGSSPLSTIVIYDPMDERTALYGMKVWEDGKVWRARLYYDDSTVMLVTDEDDGCEAKAFDFDAEEADEDAYILHDGGKMLVKHLAIDGHPYGTPLHRKAWGPQDALTKISASNMANIEGIALPARWALLDPMAEVDDDIDDDFGDAGPDTTPGSDSDDGIQGVNRGSRVRTMPGGLAMLRGIKEVGTFEAGQGSVFLENQDWYVRAMAVACGIPIFEFDFKGDQPSGESRRRAMSRALKKAKRVRRAEATFVEGLGEITLAVLGFTGSVVSSTFYPIETSTDKEGIELVAAKISAGIPVRVALIEAGYTEKDVDEWWPEDGPAITYGILTTVAGALAQLGTAETLGVIQPEETRAMLPTILTAARNEGPQPIAGGAPTAIPGVVQPGRPADLFTPAGVAAK